MKHIGERGHGRTGSLRSRYGPEQTDHRELGAAATPSLARRFLIFLFA